MNRKFFEGMKFFATAIASLGSVAVAWLLVLIFVDYSSAQLHWEYFLYAIITATAVGISYCVLRGIALIGLKIIENDK